MMISCDGARSLVPSYLDGELSEIQAAPLRAHLMDCPACREVAKEGRALQRWFEALRSEDALDTTTVPAGFAARVARRAFAGDPGMLVPEEPPAVRAHSSHLRFLLIACSVAAAALFVLALAIQRESLPRTNDLRAQEGRPPWLEVPASEAPPSAASEAGTIESERPAPRAGESTPSEDRR